MLCIGQSTNAFKSFKISKISNAQTEIRQAIADCYNVNVLNVTIVPYSAFTVYAPNAPINGMITLSDCGTDCTRVIASASGHSNSELVIVEDLEGI